VSAPAIPAVEDNDSHPSTHVNYEQPRRGLASAIDEYQFNQLQRSLV
jgi:hypothetical protein